MLNIRLALTESYVDRWVIGEGTHTFSQKPKPMYLPQGMHHIPEKFRDRIEHVIIDLSQGPDNLWCENQMRRGLQPAIDRLDSNDIVIHGDLDEIIDPTKWPVLLELLNKHDRPVATTLKMFIYHFDQQAQRNWSGPVIARRHMIQDCHHLYKGNQRKKKDRSHCYIHKESVGWHWTWIGRDEDIEKKAISCIESQHRDPAQILDSFKNLDTASAINHKCHTETVKPCYPLEVQKVLGQYPQYWTVAP